MHSISLVLTTLVALEFFFIMYLETIATTSEKTGQTFGMTTEQLRNKNVSTLLKNQGVYNALIAVLLLFGLFVFPNKLWVELLLGYIILVAAYGAYSSDPMIFPKQAGLAVLALLSLIIL